MCIHAGGMYGVIGAFVYCLKKPVYFVLFGGWVGRVVVGKLTAYFLKEIDMFGNGCAVDMS